MALKAEDLVAGTKVRVGLFVGNVVRVMKWHGDVFVDVEVGGVVDRYNINQLRKIDE